MGSERRSLNISPLPAGYNQAITTVEISELVAETSKEHMFEYLRRHELEQWLEGYKQFTKRVRKLYLTVFNRK